ncbi:hypothetical protein, variant [Fonticula alba]|nr:hypothetical protein, variant [Fonticula alba]KCV71405.1 hypothetical protein, variant [Fonticula alba]|eukprot:XP_009494527.1 hypothetical protein, variant [Fonticula alba]
MHERQAQLEERLITHEHADGLDEFGPHVEAGDEDPQHGAPADADEDLVLCTDNISFQVRRAITSNSLLLVTPTPEAKASPGGGATPATPATIPGATDTEHSSAGRRLLIQSTLGAVHECRRLPEGTRSRVACRLIQRALAPRPSPEAGPFRGRDTPFTHLSFGQLLSSVALCSQGELALGLALAGVLALPPGEWQTAATVHPPAAVDTLADVRFCLLDRAYLVRCLVAILETLPFHEALRQRSATGEILAPSAEMLVSCDPGRFAAFPDFALRHVLQLLSEPCGGAAIAQAPKPGVRVESFADLDLWGDSPLTDPVASASDQAPALRAYWLAIIRHAGLSDALLAPLGLVTGAPPASGQRCLSRRRICRLLGEHIFLCVEPMLAPAGPGATKRPRNPAAGLRVIRSDHFLRHWTRLCGALFRPVATDLDGIAIVEPAHGTPAAGASAGAPGARSAAPGPDMPTLEAVYSAFLAGSAGPPTEGALSPASFRLRYLPARRLPLSNMPLRMLMLFDARPRWREAEMDVFLRATGNRAAKASVLARNARTSRDARGGVLYTSRF